MGHVPAEELLTEPPELVERQGMGRVQPEVQTLAALEQILQAVEVRHQSVVVERGEIDAFELTYLVDEGGTPFAFPIVEDPLGQAGIDRRSGDPGPAA